jgi:Glycine/D-amino acid oxidases (deaminating)
MRQGHESLAKWALGEVTPMELNRTLNPRPDMRQIRATHRRACELLPELRRVAISNVWAGYIDSTPDGVPAIGEVGRFQALSSRPDSAVMASGLALARDI